MQPRAQCYNCVTAAISLLLMQMNCKMRTIGTGSAQCVYYECVRDLL